VAFAHVVENAVCNRYGLEIDAHRAEQARALRVDTLQANTIWMSGANRKRCPCST
jgi:hypothetical protein